MSALHPSTIAAIQAENEARLDIWREVAKTEDLRCIGKTLAEMRHELDYIRASISILEGGIADRLETLSASKQDCGDFLICKYAGKRVYDYDLALVDRVLESARNYGPDLFKLTQGAFIPTFKVKKDVLNRVLAFGGETAEIIKQMVTEKPSGPRIELVWKGSSRSEQNG